jgi:hypothetical protein
MNYVHIYDKLITKRILDTPIGYVERHHIIPRCMGGVDDRSNLVKLTPREHFIAHQLLSKMYGGKLYHAAHMMSNMGRYSSRKYSWLKEHHSKLISIKLTGIKRSEETSRKISDSKKGVLLSDDAKANISKGHTGLKQSAITIEKRMSKIRGMKLSAEAKQKISESKRNRPRTEKEVLAIAKVSQMNIGSKRSEETKLKMSQWVRSEETKKKIADANIGRKHTEETKEKMKGRIKTEEERTTISIKAKIRHSVKVICPHCSMSVSSPNFSRWHGDNCKHKGHTNEQI